MKFSVWTVFFILACLGWICGCTIHILSLMGETVPFGFWTLHIGIFVVWLPFILRAKSYNPGERRIALKQAFRYAPLWMKIIAIASWAYGFLNFFIHRPENGQVHDAHNVQFILLFSGGWIAFYAVAAAGLFPERSDAGK